MRNTVRDGVTLFYDEEGLGDPPIVLIHGWCCDHTYLAPQFEWFRRDHRVLAVDLRGHGGATRRRATTHPACSPTTSPGSAARPG
ncbi:MAG: alpha/beta hydrolase [Dehalococcoidia bacterium]